MVPSLVPSLRRGVAAHPRALRAATARLLSASAPSPVPVPPSRVKPAPPGRVAAAKELLTAPTLPRGRRGARRGGYPAAPGIFPEYAPGEDGARAPTTAPDGRTLRPSGVRYDVGVVPADMPFLHHLERDPTARPKFKNPRKRASKLYHELTREKIAESQASKPAVWEVPFKVGDAVELEVLDEGGVDNPLNKPYDLIWGVVLGRHNRGLDTGIYLKDVVHGEHVERKVKLHSPMIRSLKVLQDGFVNRGKKQGRRVKRAKLYYLRDRNPEETRVTKPQK